MFSNIEVNVYFFVFCPISGQSVIFCISVFYLIKIVTMSLWLLNTKMC